MRPTASLRQIRRRCCYVGWSIESATNANPNAQAMRALVDDAAVEVVHREGSTVQLSDILFGDVGELVVHPTTRDLFALVEQAADTGRTLTTCLSLKVAGRGGLQLTIHLTFSIDGTVHLNVATLREAGSYHVQPDDTPNRRCSLKSSWPLASASSCATDGISPGSCASEVINPRPRPGRPHRRRPRRPPRRAQPQHTAARA